MCQLESEWRSLYAGHYEREGRYQLESLALGQKRGSLKRAGGRLEWGFLEKRVLKRGGMRKGKKERVGLPSDSTTAHLC